MPFLNAVVYEFRYTGKTESVLLEPGIYKFEAWGAKGQDNGKFGGYGGYSHGNIALTKPLKVFITVGGRDGFNGGGRSYNQSITGGGATDFRFFENTLNNRVLVAGGAGAGGGDNSYSNFNGGDAGGFEGEEPQYGGEGGQRNRGGRCILYDPDLINTSPTRDGDFRKGRDVQGINAGPGGGGWYGGGAGSGFSEYGRAEKHTGPGGGGSGFVYTNESIEYLPPGYAVAREYMFSSGYALRGGVTVADITGDVTSSNQENSCAQITTYSLFNFNLNQVKPASSHRLNPRQFSLFTSIFLKIKR
ncbi:eggshell protein 1 precursor, putative [Trichomonas vaginalis G3]|uniref:receptor protein-tyrosine kinase n=1 Tax=Trichomonas vaginalis (strain ATCC PRA-98 / G3) TaxID=412133 RepID=A2F990_TRIV3|nr:glycine-rich protein family [Trichomonas vaginalis G3]EAX98513.1 eggshell protein 1 precursor, putative [Trichomonas vaginalis G3]KAI5529346.1 glycine-rich protein family [Trichomonas vaginalis G3]|eukprot:XP_001311443.1 eggshell protein 1 precursor [Trichomonas vaginalis G3]